MDSEPCCRICLSNDSPKQMISPCKCTGTQKYVHPGCLHEWQQKSMKNFVSAVYCPVCKASYRNEVKRWPVSPKTLVLLFLLAVGVWTYSLVLSGLAVGWMLARWSGVKLKYIGEPGRRRMRLIRSGDPVPELQGGVVLEATDKISSGIFQGSRIAIILYTYELGALGLILNKTATLGDRLVSIGGPVQLATRHFLHDNANVPGVRLSESLYYSAIVRPNAGQLRTFQGYSGWSCSQLDGEVASGCWRICGLVTAQDVFPAEGAPN